MRSDFVLALSSAPIKDGPYFFLVLIIDYFQIGIIFVIGRNSNSSLQHTAIHQSFNFSRRSFVLEV